MQKLQFKNGDKIPQLGLGTWKSDPGEVYKAVRTAIKQGYRHIDCALVYGNEAEIGHALKDAFDDGDVTREDLFITSKLWNTHHKENDVLPALKTSLNDLKLDYLDLYLIHWPVCISKDASFPMQPNDFIPVEEIPLEETWKAMVDCRDKGLIKHAGVSNFSISNLNTLIRSDIGVPEMNQVEPHPYLNQKELLAFCTDHEILLTAYSPLGSTDRSTAMKGKDEPRLLDDSLLASIASRYNCSVAQVILAWQVQRGACVIPKSVNESRLKENLEAASIALSDKDMDDINHLKRDFRFINGSFWTIEGSPYTLEYLWG